MNSASCYVNGESIAGLRSMQVLFGEASLTLLEPPMNAMRLGLHPDGLASRILNFSAWRRLVIGIIKHPAEVSADPELISPLNEVQGYDYSSTRTTATEPVREDFAIPLQ